MKCVVGSYTGDGADNRAITGIGFRPDLVIIKNRVLNWGCFRTSTMPDDSTAFFAQAAVNFAGGVKTLDADGFTVGTHASVNSSGQVYDWQAFKDDGAGDFKVGSYVGDGADDRDLTGLGFQPDIVCVKVNGTGNEGYFRTSSNSGDQSMRFTAYGDGANNIQAFLADGFQVGTAQNASGATHHWFAFKAVAGYIAVGSYSGNDTDDRDIAGGGFQPDLVWVKSAGFARCAVRPSTLTGDSTQFYTWNSAAADWIQALQADGFQVGTQINVSGIAYRWVAWKAGATPGGVTEKAAADAAGATDTAALAAALPAADAGAAAETSELAADFVEKATGDSAAATEAAALAAATAGLDSGAGAETGEVVVPVAGADAGAATETALIFPLVDSFELNVTVTPALGDRFDLIASVFLDRVADTFELQATFSPLVADPFLLTATIINQEQEQAAAEAVIAPTADIAFL